MNNQDKNVRAITTQPSSCRTEPGDAHDESADVSSGTARNALQLELLPSVQPDMFGVEYSK